MDIALTISVSVLVLTLLNLGLVMLVLVRINGLRKDLRTPVVKKFNADFKRKPVDIPRIQDNFSKSRDDKSQGRISNQAMANRSKTQRPVQVRRPAAKAPDVFSNEVPASQASTPIPPRPVAIEPAPAAEGRRPLPPRFNAAANNADLPHVAPAPVSSVANEGGEDSGMEFDRSKMAHGRRNVVAKPAIEDDGSES